jgi:hypothetical protein
MNPIYKEERTMDYKLQLIVTDKLPKQKRKKN